MAAGRVVLAGFIALSLAGCSSVPTGDELAAANYGRDMRLTDCAAAADEWIASQMRDPSSVQFRRTSCDKGYWGSNPIAGTPKAYGWLYAGEVNAKNAFGGYVGFRSFKVLLLDGKIIRQCISDGGGLCIDTDG